MATGRLTQKQKMFCHEYLVDCNASRAARSAGYSEKYVDSKSSQLMRLPHVQRYLTQLLQERRERVDITADEVLRRHIEIDNLDPVDIFNEDFTFKPMEEWPREWRIVIDGIKVRHVIEREGMKVVERAEIVEIKWPSKLKNLELIGKHVDVSAYKEKVELSATELTLKNMIDLLDGKTCGLPKPKKETYN